MVCTRVRELRGEMSRILQARSSIALSLYTCLVQHEYQQTLSSANKKLFHFISVIIKTIKMITNIIIKLKIISNLRLKTDP